MKVVMFTNHYARSKRKAGFHWLAESYAGRGWDTTLVTISLSWLSFLRKDPRCAYPVRQEAGRCIPVKPHLWSYVHFTPLHPANLRSRLANRLAEPLFAAYGRRLPGALQEVVRGADVLVFESSGGLLLVEAARALNPGATLVYRVSDDLRLLKPHPVVEVAERRALPLMELVSVPAAVMAEKFRGHSNVRVHPHGIQTDLFDAPSKNPYAAPGPHVIFVGNSHFDTEFLAIAAALRPDVTFHIVGPIADLPTRQNVISYGELPFSEIIPFMKWADAGLQTRAYSPGAESLNESLKIKQYTYCSLPIVAPDFLRNGRGHMHYYRPGDEESIGRALAGALAFDRSAVDRSDVLSWDDVADQLLQDAGIGE